MPRAKRQTWQRRALHLKTLTGTEVAYPDDAMACLLGPQFLNAQGKKTQEDLRSSLLKIVAVVRWQRHQERRPTKGERLVALEDVASKLEAARAALEAVDADSLDLMKSRLGRNLISKMEGQTLFGHTQDFLSTFFKDGGAGEIGRLAFVERGGWLSEMAQAARSEALKANEGGKGRKGKMTRVSDAYAIEELAALWRSTGTMKPELTVLRLRDFAVAMLAPLYLEDGEKPPDLRHAAEIGIDRKPD